MTTPTKAIEPTKLFTVVCVDDDPDALLDLEDEIKEFDSIRLLVASNGDKGLELIRQRIPDLVLLDITMPGQNGLEICKQLRDDERLKNIPVIFVSGRILDIDRIQGLELGADDYVIKPYHPRELVLRILGVLKRVYGGQFNLEQVTVGEITIDLARHKVWVEGEVVELTLSEFKLLAALVQAGGRVRTRDELLGDIFDYSGDVISRTVDTHIQRLRGKLKVAADQIETVRGVGYRIKG